MAVTLLMPNTGATFKIACITKWYKQEGDSFIKGEPLLEVITKKALFKVEAPVNGFVYKLLAPEKTDLLVDIPIAILAEEGDETAMLDKLVSEAKDSF